MKTINFLRLTILFTIISVLSVSTAFAQQVSAPACVYCGHRIHSAYDHATNCPYYPKGGSKAATSVHSNLTYQQQFLMNFLSGALNNLINGSPQKKPTAQENSADQQVQTDAQTQARLAAAMAEQKRYNDALAKAKHDQMMAYYKKLDGGGDLKFKSLDDESWKPSVHFNCKITAFKGDVIVLKTNGERIVLSDNKSVDLAPGDWIATGKGSRIKMHYDFENGGEDMTLQPNSAINIITNEEGTHIPELVKGGMYVVNKSGEGNYYQKDVGIIDQATFEANRLMANVKKFKKKFKIHTPTAVTAVQGTEFTLNVDDFNNTEVNVKSGIVDLTGNLTHGTITLTAGTKGIVKATGEIIGPLEMDGKQFEENDDNWE